MSHPTDSNTKIPVGVERVLVAAAQDEPFRVRLLQDRQAAIAELGPVLRPSELAIILTITDKQLVQAITAMGSSPDDREALPFLAAVAETITDMSTQQRPDNREPADTMENPIIPPMVAPPAPDEVAVPAPPSASRGLPPDGK